MPPAARAMFSSSRFSKYFGIVFKKLPEKIFNNCIDSGKHAKE
jgi:hypothetical protein